MNTGLSLEIRQGNKTKIIAKGHPDFKNRLYPKNYNAHNLVNEYVQEFGYRLKSITELFDGGYVKNYWASVENINPNPRFFPESTKKNIWITEEIGIDNI